MAHFQQNVLVPYRSIIGLLWTHMEFEEKAAYRRGNREGLLTLNADKRVVAREEVLLALGLSSRQQAASPDERAHYR